MTPIIKYWTCKRAPQHAAEALECLGGAGYVEESDLPRLFRQSPLNGVWEGSGNVICLDVLRAIARDPGVLDAYWDEVGLAGGADGRLDDAATALRAELADLDQLETRARRLVERLATVFQAALLVRHAPPPSPTRSAPPGSPVTPAARSARCRRTRRGGDRRPRPSGPHVLTVARTATPTRNRDFELWLTPDDLALSPADGCYRRCPVRSDGSSRSHMAGRSRGLVISGREGMQIDRAKQRQHDDQQPPPRALAGPLWSERRRLSMNPSVVMRP